MELIKFKNKFEKEINKKIDFKKSFINNQIDSLDLISLVMIVEKELKIKISENKLSKLENFIQLETLVKKLKNK
jgi:acyl carrier protein